MIPVTTTIFLNNEFYEINVELTEDEAKERLLRLWYGHFVSAANREFRQTRALPFNAARFAKTFDLNILSSAPADEIEEEALTLAENEIKKRLAIDGLPPPRDLRIHARMLVMQDESFQSRARQRLLARAEVVSEILGGA